MAGGHRRRAFDDLGEATERDHRQASGRAARIRRAPPRRLAGAERRVPRAAGRAAREVAVQPVAGPGASARDLAAHHARRVPQGRHALGDLAGCRCPVAAGRRALRFRRRPVPGAGQPPCADPAGAGRRRRRRGARVRHRGQGLRRRRVPPAGRQVARQLARPGHALHRHRLRPRVAHALRLCAPRQGLAARHAAVGRRAAVRGQGRLGVGQRAAHRHARRPGARCPQRGADLLG